MAKAAFSRTSRSPADPGLASRRLAAHAVAEVLRRRASLDETFERLARQATLDERDAGLARAIAVTTFRRFGTIRTALTERLAKGPPKDEAFLGLLATGAAQILFLDVPDHAAVDLAVRLARTEGRPGLAGLVNAVLRRIARERDTILAGSDPLRVDTPEWLARRWSRHYGAAAPAIAEAHRAGGSLDLSVRSDPALWAERLGGTVLATGTVRLTQRTPIRELPGYGEGAWWVQDAAAALPARFLAAGPGERVIDLCAAPGGKTAQLASRGAHVVAVDRSEARLKRLRENMERLQLSVETRMTDVLALHEEPFDAVLLDAPCSATGTLRRNPDAAWTKRESDLSQLVELQTRLLDKAAALTRPEGRLVYCTCSLEPEEGERQVAAFLERHPEFVPAPLGPDDVPGLSEAVTPEGWLRTLPHYGGPQFGGTGMDGFFAARFRRRSV